MDPGQPKSEKGHNGAINSFDISFDSKFIVTGGCDSVFRVWDLQSFYKNSDKGFEPDQNQQLKNTKETK
jgi:WD40 repeat protein